MVKGEVIRRVVPNTDKKREQECGSPNEASPVRSVKHATGNNKSDDNGNKRPKKRAHEPDHSVADVLM
jgi:hypothetical protein